MERRYSVILGDLGNTRAMLRQATPIPHVRGIELVGTWDVAPENAREMNTLLRDLGLQTVSIIPSKIGDTVACPRC